MKTGFKDRNGTDINVGDSVKFKCCGNNYITQEVRRSKNGYTPFDRTIRIEASPYTDPSECVIIKKSKSNS